MYMYMYSACTNGWDSFYMPSFSVYYKYAVHMHSVIHYVIIIT